VLRNAIPPAFTSGGILRTLAWQMSPVSGNSEPFPQPSPASIDRAVVRRRLTVLGAAIALLLLAFSVPLYGLVRYSISSDLFSYIPLIPLVSLWLVWTERRKCPWDPSPSRGLAWIPLSIGLLFAAYGLGSGLSAQADYLALMTLSFLCLLVGTVWFVLGSASMRFLAFPAGYLVFCIPFPEWLHRAVEDFLQHASADFAQGFFWISGTAFFREDTVFHLPGFTLQVAPECSGIHSTWVLLITSVLGGQLFLRSPWRRVLLCVAILPLALIRNGIRILVIGELCVHVGPYMIDSYIHRHGGPIFFVLSLIPFFYFLRYLRRSESTRKPGVPPDVVKASH